MNNVHTLFIRIIKQTMFLKSFVFKKQLFFLEKTIYKNEEYNAIPLASCIHNLSNCVIMYKVHSLMV